jgi:hypothetical protein
MHLPKRILWIASNSELIKFGDVVKGNLHNEQEIFGDAMDSDIKY